MKVPAVLLTLVVVSLAGCTDDAPTDDASIEDVESVVASQSTGGIRGVVVDDAIRPLEGATVVLSNGLETLTDDRGIFVFNALPPGEYFVTVSLFAYQTTQASTLVVAGVTEPEVLRVTITAIPGLQPYQTEHHLRGFYECGFSAGTSDLGIITDSCDMGVRTLYDEYEAQTGDAPPFPRNLQNNHNTEYLSVEGNVQTIVQEAFWDNADVPKMMITLSSTPIHNDCDCADTDYLEVFMGSPTYGRLDDKAVPRGLDVAARGFLDWHTTSYGLNHDFDVFTTLFHNQPAPEGWTIAQ